MKIYLELGRRCGTHEQLAFDYQLTVGLKDIKQTDAVSPIIKILLHFRMIGYRQVML